MSNVCAGWMYGDEKISFMGALALSIGIAIQNFPEMAEGRHSNVGTVCFATGFILMMALDVGLG